MFSEQQEAAEGTRTRTDFVATRSTREERGRAGLMTGEEVDEGVAH